VLQSIGFAAAYTGVGIALLVLGFYSFDLLTPGNLGRHISEHRSVNAAVAVSGGFLGQGAIVFASIWTNATAASAGHCCTPWSSASWGSCCRPWRSWRWT